MNTTTTLDKLSQKLSLLAGVRRIRQGDNDRLVSINVRGHKGVARPQVSFDSKECGNREGQVDIGRARSMDENAFIVLTETVKFTGPVDNLGYEAPVPRIALDAVVNKTIRNGKSGTIVIGV